MKEGKYLHLWQKYLPVLRLMMKQSVKQEKELQLSKAEFEVAGDRDLSNYVFNLEIQNGKVTNDITGTAVARDLYTVLIADAALKEFFKDKKVKVNMGVSFSLKFKAEETR